MTNRPRLLDTFCGAVGGSEGYQRAGFAPYGIDNRPQPHYPFPFLLMDSLEALDRLLEGGEVAFSNGETLRLDDFAAYHASPPCQGYSTMRNLPWWPGKEYELLILPMKELLEATGKLFVIENVMGARHKSGQLSKIGAESHGLEAGWLCGLMFGLPLYRHRLFYTNWFWLAPGHPKHMCSLRKGKQFGGSGGRLRDVLDLNHPVGCMTLSHAPKDRVGTAKKAMGVEWMTGDETSEAIPPAYTEYIGKCLMQTMKKEHDSHAYSSH